MAQVQGAQLGGIAQGGHFLVFQPVILAGMAGGKHPVVRPQGIAALAQMQRPHDLDASGRHHLPEFRQDLVAQAAVCQVHPGQIGHAAQRCFEPIHPGDLHPRQVQLLGGAIVIRALNDDHGLGFLLRPGAGEQRQQDKGAAQQLFHAFSPLSRSNG